MFKKLFLPFLGVFLVFTLVFTAFMPVLAYEGQEFLEYLDIDENSRCAMLFLNVIDRFPRVLVYDGFTEREVVRYPDEFAGAFIDKSNKLHIVLIKDVDLDTEYDYRNLTGYDETVIFDIADYSLFFLYEVQRTLNPVMNDFDIRYTGIDETTNRLNVGLFDRTRERDVVEFLKTKFDGFDARCITFMDSPVIGPAMALDGSDDSQGSLQSWVMILLVVGVVCLVVFSVVFVCLRRRRKSGVSQLDSDFVS